MEMEKTLKGLSVKKAVRSLIICVAIWVVVAVAASLIFGLHKMLNPTNLADVTIGEESVGEYVSFDIELVYGEYCYTGSSSTSWTAREYVVVAPDWEHLIGIELRKSKALELEPLFDKQWDEILSDSYDENNPMIVTVTGTLQAMDSQSTRFFKTVLNDMQFAEDIGQYYIVRVGYVGEISDQWIYIFAGLCALSILLSLIGLIRALTGNFQSGLRKYVNGTPNPEATWAQLDAWFPQAQKFGKELWVSPGLFISQEGTKTKVFDMNQYVWAYKRTTKQNGVETGHSLVMCTLNKKENLLNAGSGQVDDLLTYIMQNCPLVAVGFDSERRKMYRKNPVSMQDVARQQRAPMQAASPYGTPASPYGAPQTETPPAVNEPTPATPVTPTEDPADLT